MPRPAAKPTAPTTAKTKPTSCANFSGGTGSFSVTGAEPRCDERGEDQAVGVLARPAAAPIAKTTACSAEDDRGGDEADARHQQRDDQNGGGDPRGEARAANVDLIAGLWSCWAWFGCHEVTLLLLEGLGVSRPHQGRSERAREMSAAALSSYNNNSNNPRRGTDRLRGAW